MQTPQNYQIELEIVLFFKNILYVYVFSQGESLWYNC